ncbi:branched-chain amino acid ABC transporter substrate-binding protein [Deinococcus aquiradiocola]|uniref:Branched chain amino acid ABC transporter substrate-binding protein n=1 Tax=Deinococcus aquiradiocola TaxID=393059 RepID=A0A917UKS8_9DEIO|nr:branched-chain amino acid ABC transporter substrate-binding protein [Deinococcus aquiradiocola]GGJ64756.1 branched chain amino acid ABC transporter substrate-binding protein [Deinococcus aquiradiocola]
MKKLGLSILTLGALSMGGAHAATVIKIASMSPLSGGSSDLGLQIRNATELAIKDNKAAFKALGFDLQFVAYDDQGDPTTGTANARRIAADNSILAMVGTLNSGVVIPSSEVLAPSHVAIVSPANTNPKVTDRGLANMNRICARDDSQGPAGADFLVNTLKAKKVYVLNDKTPYGQGLADAAEAFMKTKGTTIVASEGTEEKSDFSSIITKIQALRPDAIYFGGLYGQVGPFAKQLREKGITIPVMGGDGYDSPDLLTLAGAGAKDIYFTTVAPPLNAVPTARVLASRYKAAYKKELAGFGIMGYDSAKVVITGVLNAIKANGNKLPTRTQVETAIRKTNITTGLLTGAIDFNSIGDRTSAKMYIIQVKNDASNKLDFSTAGTVTVKVNKQ